MKEAVLYSPQKGRDVRCLACAHHCIIQDGRTGICAVRKNIDGKLFNLVYGKIASVGIDPIEKKPLFHFLPKTKTYSISTVGCNFRCGFCQNYGISQASKSGFYFGEEMSPEKVVKEALASGCKSISYTYNEPTISIEFVKDTSTLSAKKGLKNIMVTNGYLSKESLKFITGSVDAMNIDLKSFSEKFYQKHCGASLEPVLDTIKEAHKKKIWLEITTLVIPGENDSKEELEKIAGFISSIDKRIPWHISRFFPRYKMLDTLPTSIQSLKEAGEIGKRHLNNVYLGNI